MNPQAKLDALVKELSEGGNTVVFQGTITKGGTETQLLSKTVVPEPVSAPVVEKPAPVVPQPKAGNIS